MSGRLLLDLGNTRLKWALGDDCPDDEGADASCLHSFGALAHGGPDFLPALESRLRSLPAVESVHLVAVASEPLVEAVERTVLNAVRCRRSRIDRARTQAQARLGSGRQLQCAYAVPDHLGADRWLAMRGALALCAPPLLVVSAGTALTLDAVDGSDRHLGGLILAGIGSLHEVLLRRAPHLRGECAVPTAELWATDTAPAIASAPWHAAAGLVERAVRRLPTADGRSPTVVLAGGDAERLASLIDAPVRLEPHLVLKGLNRAARDPQASVG